MRHPPDWNWYNDTWTEQDPEEGELYSLASAYWSQYVFINGTIKTFDMIILGDTQGIKGAGKIYDNEPLTPLEHEIRHIQCRCAWHNGGN